MQPSIAAPRFTIPDFTKGDAIPQSQARLEPRPTGARGWMHCDTMVTSDARQIAITKVEPKSPAMACSRSAT
jgi:hypothetical protein